MINSFSGPYRFLSNFYPAVVLLDGVPYPTVEHAFQAAKTADTGDRAIIRSLPTPLEAKAFGKRVLLREDWETVKIEVMTDLVRQKFHQVELREKLLATGDQTLVEGNRWGDMYWGVCRGQGMNWLGRILMKVREEIRKDAVPRSRR